jgi:hypothetical protein
MEGDPQLYYYIQLYVVVTAIYFWNISSTLLRITALNNCRFETFTEPLMVWGFYILRSQNTSLIMAFI